MMNVILKCKKESLNNLGTNSVFYDALFPFVISQSRMHEFYRFNNVCYVLVRHY